MAGLKSNAINKFCYSAVFICPELLIFHKKTSKHSNCFLRDKIGIISTLWINVGAVCARIHRHKMAVNISHCF